MKKLIVVTFLILLTAGLFSSCKTTKTCPAYSQSPIEQSSVKA